MSLVRNLALAAIAAVGLSGCATFDPYYGASVGVGSGYYGGGYGYNGGYAPYGAYGSYGGYGSPYGSYGSPYGGWNGGYYYPGTGAYVYDQQRRRYPISTAQRRYWEQQRIARSLVRERHQQIRRSRGQSFDLCERTVRDVTRRRLQEGHLMNVSRFVQQALARLDQRFRTDVVRRLDVLG